MIPPREPLLTPLQVALALIIGLTIIGLMAFAAVDLAAVVRFTGWMGRERI